MTARPTLKTARLTLTPLCLDDEAALEPFIADKRVAEMTTSIGHPNPPGETRAFIERVMDPSNKDITWTIRENGRPLGVITLRANGELGYWLGPPFWGLGIMTEAGQAVMAHAIARGETRIHAQHYKDNPASGRVMENLGMTCIGDGARVFSRARGEEVEQLLYERRLDYG